MACGTPVLTYKTGGCPEIIEKYGGIVVKQGDISYVVELCKKFKEKKLEITNRFCSEENDNFTVIQEYLNLYI